MPASRASGGSTGLRAQLWRPRLLYARTTRWQGPVPVLGKRSIQFAEGLFSAGSLLALLRAPRQKPRLKR